MSDETHKPNTPETPASKRERLFTIAAPGPERNHRLAYLMLREGKQFYHAALEAGFPESMARQGLAFAKARTSGLADAFAAEAKVGLTSEELRVKCVNAIVKDIDERRNTGIERKVEVLGKMRVYDWFVRNSETQIGIFMGISESTPTHDDTIEVYPE